MTKYYDSPSRSRTWFEYHPPRTFKNGWTVQKLAWNTGTHYRVTAPAGRSSLSTTTLTYKAALAYIRKHEVPKGNCTGPVFKPEAW